MIKKFFLIFSVLILIMPFGAQAATQSINRIYIGYINDKYPVEFNINYKSNTIDGSYFYAKVKKKIVLKGSIVNSHIMLNEYSGNKITAKLDLTEKDNTLKGEWITADKSKKYKVYLQEIFNNLPGYSKYSGHYETPDNYRIDIFYLGNNKAKIQGEAYWQGVNPENIHTGVIADIVDIKNNAIHYTDGEDEYSCKLDIKYLSPSKIQVKDNYQCGGMNVSFDGIYTRKSLRTGSWDLFMGY